MAHGNVPGLDKALTKADLEKSREIYNGLLDDSKQPTIDASHLQYLANLFVRYNVHDILGIHLVHAHFKISENTVLVGVNHDLGVSYKNPRCRFTQATCISTVDFNNIHGHIFVLKGRSFHPYEYQAGPIPELARENSNFLIEFADYLEAHELAEFVGLEVLDLTPYPSEMMELVFLQETIMLDSSNLKGCVSACATGWRFNAGNGQRTCTPYVQHAAKPNGEHDTYNAGSPHPKLQDVILALEKENILTPVA